MKKVCTRWRRPFVIHEYAKRGIVRNNNLIVYLSRTLLFIDKPLTDLILAMSI